MPFRASGTGLQYADHLTDRSPACHCRIAHRRDKLEFILNAYDFDGSQELSIDEVTLAMKSTLTGLCKMSRERMPREEELEVKAMHCFEDALGEGGESSGGVGGKVRAAAHSKQLQRRRYKQPAATPSTLASRVLLVATPDPARTAPRGAPTAPPPCRCTSAA